jgi:hypothetical protein
MPYTSFIHGCDVQKNYITCIHKKSRQASGLTALLSRF